MLPSPSIESRRNAPPTVVEASAPTRIDLAGGTLDIWPISLLVPRAVTVNLAVDLRAHARIERRADDRVVVRSRDRATRTTRRLPLDPETIDGPLSLPLRLVATFAPQRGLVLTLHALAPAGAGLGGSSTLSVAVAGALRRFTGGRLDRDRLLRRVMNVEAREIRVPTGSQDYLAALHGGLSAWWHDPDGSRREKLPIPGDLDRRLVLAYTGEPRQSGLSNWDMFRRFVNGEGSTVRRMESIASLARSMRDALAARDLDEAGRILGEEGRLRYALAPSVATPALRTAGTAARRAGAIGVKVCGAGGGGCLVAWCRRGREAAVSGALERSGAKVLPCRISRGGLRVRAG